MKESADHNCKCRLLFYGKRTTVLNIFFCVPCKRQSHFCHLCYCCWHRKSKCCIHKPRNNNN